MRVPPPPTLGQSRARVPDAWLTDRRRRKLSSWELERLQRLLEHSSDVPFASEVSDTITAAAAAAAAAGATDSDGVAVGGGIDSSTSPIATTTTTASTAPPSTSDLEERLTTQIAQRFSKMEM